MTDKQTQQQAPHGNTEEGPQTGGGGDEPMTGAQRSSLKTLSEQAHEPFDDTLTQAQASRRIDELQARIGRGSHGTAAQHTGEAHPEGPLESLGRAISEPVFDAQAPREPED